VLLGPRIWLLTVLSIGGYGVLVFFRPVLAEVTHVHGAPTGTFEPRARHVGRVRGHGSSSPTSSVACRGARRPRARVGRLARHRRAQRASGRSDDACGRCRARTGDAAGDDAVTAREIERVASRARLPLSAGLCVDAALIAREVARCHRTLDEMSGVRAGWHSMRPAGAACARRRTPAVAVPAMLGELPSGPPDEAFAELPHDDLVRVVVALLRNALDASPPGGRARLRAMHADGTLAISVEDDGHGMPPEVLARVDEPFFTTKPPGQGFGLGVFLARSFVEQLGGALDVSSVEEVGTTVTLRLPTGRAA
jgi:two-component system sensor histidine kinase RegB